MVVKKIHLIDSIQSIEDYNLTSKILRLKLSCCFRSGIC